MKWRRYADNFAGASRYAASTTPDEAAFDQWMQPTDLPLNSGTIRNGNDDAATCDRDHRRTVTGHSRHTRGVMR
jgi:hypothetical protein